MGPVQASNEAVSLYAGGGVVGGMMANKLLDKISEGWAAWVSRREKAEERAETARLLEQRRKEEIEEAKLKLTTRQMISGNTEMMARIVEAQQQITVALQAMTHQLVELRKTTDGINERIERLERARP